ncbi:flagellar biosynthetic protein FliO [Ancylobacter defluvii]|nr:flagellar biosynthetic protein FliO [Ancylobacter defluvii]MBS7587727.1 flagellar biosynthetic protein FliO [Ancylobacter defluvii]
MFDTLFANGSLTGTGVLAAIGIGLILLVVLVIRLGRRNRHRPVTVGGLRLAVLDQIPIDETRRLVLIQRDDVQHLVILGGGSDFLVEAGIGRAPARQAAAPAEPAPVAERAPAAPPKPVPAPRPAAPVREATPVREAAPPPVVPGTPATSAPRPAVTAAAASVVAAAAAVPDARPKPTEPPVPVFDATEMLPEPAPAEPPAAETRPAASQPTEETRAPGGTGRVAVKLDPHFAGMVDQLEATLRRPTAEAASRAAPPIGPAESATDNPRAEAPLVQPAERPGVVDPDFENEMASLLGRNRRP